MPVGLGPRFLIEAGFIIAVAITAGLARLHWFAIVLVMAAAWLVVTGVEVVVSRARAARRGEAAIETPTSAVAAPVAPPEPSPPWPTTAVRVLRPADTQAPEPAPAPEVTPVPT